MAISNDVNIDVATAVPPSSSRPPPPASPQQQEEIVEEDQQQHQQNLEVNVAIPLLLSPGVVEVVAKEPPPQQQLLPAAVQQHQEEETAETILIIAAPQALQIVGCRPDSAVVAVPAEVNYLLSSQPSSSSPLHNHQQQPIHDPAVALVAHSSTQPDQQNIAQESVEEVARPPLSSTTHQQQVVENCSSNLVDNLSAAPPVVVDDESPLLPIKICKAKLIKFAFETSLLRDETKIQAIFKMLPEYAESNTTIVAEYQGDCIEGIFTADDHHIVGQSIDQHNGNKQMRGIVYYVRQFSTGVDGGFECADDDVLCEPNIIVCWADDTASKSQIFLEHTSFDDYLQLQENRYFVYIIRLLNHVLI